MHLAILDLTLLRARHLEIEYAHSESLLTLISPAVARAHHDAGTGVLLAAKIHHGVGERWIALNPIRPGPEEEVDWCYILDRRGSIGLPHYRLEVPRST